MAAHRRPCRGLSVALRSTHVGSTHGSRLLPAEVPTNVGLAPKLHTSEEHVYFRAEPQALTGVCRV